MWSLSRSLTAAGVIPYDDKALTYLTLMKNKILLFVIAISLIGLTPPVSRADPVSVRANSIKTAYLFNLLKFIEWPNQHKAKVIDVCSFSDADINQPLASLRTRKAKQKLIQLIQLSPTDRLPDNCSLVFFDADNAEQSKNIYSQVAYKGVLLVGESDDFVNNKGHIGLVLEENRVKLKIHLNRTKDSGFKLSGKLLEIAQLISTPKS